ncbi:hypothetical protein X777_12741 [Ooceraea biroi]|uniref:Uncharacterized protein n=1 Tax=Ooceraea biroi TaxID=2015173 RepID=A0A026VYS9_OOCBI|nr:hypothetical protein X777_12741 [Ooceraea biroi]
MFNVRKHRYCLIDATFRTSTSPRSIEDKADLGILCILVNEAPILFKHHGNP